MKAASLSGLENRSLVSRPRLVPFLPRLNGPPPTNQLLCRNRNHTFQVEVEVDDKEDPEGAFKRFRYAVMNASIIYEARKRRFFENPQDIKKRKQQEKGLRKQRDKREAFMETLADRLQSEAEPHVFGDLFPVYAQTPEEESELPEQAPTIPTTLDTGLRPGLNPEEYQKIERLTRIAQQLSAERWGQRTVESAGPVEQTSSVGRNGANSEPRSRHIPFETSKERRAKQKADRDLHQGQSKRSGGQVSKRESDSLDWNNTGSSSLDLSHAEARQPAQENGSSIVDATKLGAPSTDAKSKRFILGKDQKGNERHVRALQMIREGQKEFSEEERTLLWEEAAYLAKNQTSLQNQPRTKMTHSQRTNLKNKISKIKKDRQAISVLLDGQLPEAPPQAEELPQPEASPKPDAFPEPKASPKPESAQKSTALMSEEALRAESMELAERQSALENRDRTGMTQNQRISHRHKIRRTKERILRISHTLQSRAVGGASSKSAPQNGWADNSESDAIEGAREQLSSQFTDVEEPSKSTASV